jgi:membrane protein implicated in regulation of membrane protease activity
MEELLWLWWLVGALLLGVVELMTVDFVFLMLASGAVAAGVSAWIGLTWWGTIIVFAVVSIVMLAAVRPLLLNRLRLRGDAEPVSGAAALVGRKAVAVTAVDSQGGRVKIGGDVWTARLAEDQEVQPTTELKVVAIDGATAVVEVAPKAHRDREGREGQELDEEG